MSSRREIFIRILALLQRKTLLETKNRTLKCVKRHYSTVQSMKNVAVLTEDGASLYSVLKPYKGSGLGGNMVGKWNSFCESHLLHVGKFFGST